MRLSTIRPVYDAEGPFATVYLEGRSPSEDAEKQVRLRWDDLRGQLASAGADEGLLESLDSAVMVEDIGEVMTDGRVLVANESGVLLNAPWDASLGAGDAAHFSPEANLGPYVRERARSVRLLLAVADQQGALVRQLVVAEQHTLDERDQQEVGASSDESVHKPRGGALSHKQIQRRADEAIKENVREVADHMARVARTWQPDVVVLAGEVQGRTALREELPTSLAEITREADSGGVSDDGAEEALAEELRAIAGDVSEQRSQELTERFEHGRAHDLASQGAAAVARAAEMGAVEILLLEYDRQATDESSLLAASTRIDAQVGVIDSPVEDAVAAVLRFEAPERAGAAPQDHT